VGKGGERVTSTAHDRVVRYLAATGWRPPDEVGEVGGLWRHPTSQHLLPVPNELVEGGIDWQVIAERVGMLEGATAADVAARLGGEAVDIANLRAAKDLVIRDTIPYAAGVTLVQSSWTMLRSSATTALGQRALIRNYSKSGDELIASARMAHTRKGSFVIPIVLPLSEPGPPKSRNRRLCRIWASPPRRSLLSGVSCALSPRRSRRWTGRSFSPSASPVPVSTRT
jgi:hypothetical protein